MRHRLAVEHDALERQRARMASVIATNSVDQSRPLRPQTNGVAVLESQDAKTIVLQLVNPAVARRHPTRERRLARDDEAGRLEALWPDPALRGAHQHRCALARERGVSPCDRKRRV